MVVPFVSNVMSNKYDTALDFHVSMYDELPYQRDSDYCNREKLTLHSSSLMKLYMFENEASIIDNGDEHMEAYLSELLLKEANQSRISSASRARAETESSGVTEKQIQTLLDDNGNPMNQADDEGEALGNTTNPFADVEDW